MKRLIRDFNGNIGELIQINGSIPNGWELIPEAEQIDSSLAFERQKKMTEIRSKRDFLLIENDKQWLIKSKKGESTAALETEAQTLRDLPEVAEEALAELESVEEIQAYDAFEDL